MTMLTYFSNFFLFLSKLKKALTYVSPFQNHTTMLYVTNLVNGTATNAEGYALFVAVDAELRRGNTVKLSFRGCTTPPSSSFLNSSLGELVENYGKATLRERLKLVDADKRMASIIANYLSLIPNRV